MNFEIKIFDVQNTFFSNEKYRFRISNEPKEVSFEDENFLKTLQEEENKMPISMDSYKRKRQTIGSGDTQMMIGTFQAVVRPMTASNPLDGLTQNEAEQIDETEIEEKNSEAKKN